MCDSLLDDASFWRLLVDIYRELAATISSQGCPCGRTLHSARYPRKPRDWPREQLGGDYESRLSFCCNQEGCRCRCTPPSVRYFGRRVYLIDGVFSPKSNGQLRFHRVNVPTSKELNALVVTISERVARYLERQGRPARGARPGLVGPRRAERSSDIAVGRGR